MFFATDLYMDLLKLLYHFHLFQTRMSRVFSGFHSAKWMSNRIILQTDFPKRAIEYSGLWYPASHETHYVSCHYAENSTRVLYEHLIIRYTQSLSHYLL